MDEKPIGGYFELELSDKGSFIHDDGVLLNSGRNAFEFILRTQTVSHIWVPYYTCDVVLDPLDKLHIPYSFYHVDSNLEIQDPSIIKQNDFLLYTNYFGVKDSYVKQLAKGFQSRLIIDNSQALFSDPIPGTSCFYSPRKFVGVPDGGIAFSNCSSSSIELKRSLSFDRCSHLLKRIDLGPKEGYLDFKHNESSLAEQPISKMSLLLKSILKSIDFERVKSIRLSNYKFLSRFLGDFNILSLPEISSFKCPMVYPFLTQDDSLKDRLIKNKVFVATYWPNVVQRVLKSDFEVTLVDHLLALPCDQRYNELDLKRIIDIVLG